MTGESTSKHPPIGPVGDRAIANIEQLRKARGMSFRDLAAQLTALGRPILPSTLHRQSQSRRRVDADDLAAFAGAFGVTVADLLEERPGVVLAGHPAVIAVRALADRIAELVVAAGDSQATDRALRRVQIEVEELTAATGNRAQA